MTTGARPTERFSDRVAAYVRCRPGYPDAVGATLAAQAGLGRGSVVADVGSGTGILTSLFLRLGCDVFAVEPNAAMRAAAEEQLADMPGFHSIQGTAEAEPFGTETLSGLLALADKGIHDLIAKQREITKPILGR